MPWLHISPVTDIRNYDNTDKFQVQDETEEEGTKEGEVEDKTEEAEEEEPELTPEDKLVIVIQ